MKTLLLGLGVLLLGLASPIATSAQMFGTFGPGAYYGARCSAAAYPGCPYYSYPAPAPYPAYGYPVYPYYPYPLPPAPSLGFGRGGIYGHVFTPRDEGVTSYTFPGADSTQ
jgi:hypothetical protein